MSNKTKILSELSKIIVESMSSFSDIKKEIETIVKIRVEKIINRNSTKHKKNNRIKRIPLQSHEITSISIKYT